MSQATPTADGGRIAAELRHWARGCHSTEAAVELLIRSRGGRFLEPGQPWLRTDDRGITWLDAHVIERYSHAVSSEERHILALVEALALGKRSKMWAVSWPAWTPTISVSFLASCGMPAVAAVDMSFLRRPRTRVLVMTDDGRDRCRCLTSIATARLCLPMVASSDQEDANGLSPSAAGLSESTAHRRGAPHAVSTVRKCQLYGSPSYGGSGG